MKKVLIVDDQDFLRIFLRKALEKKGFEVVEAADGNIAVEMIGSHPDIELLIMDLKMPRMDGKEAFRIIHSLRPTLKCLISAADITREDVEVLSAMGVNAFLEKPYLLGELYRAISDLSGSLSDADICELKASEAAAPCLSERRQIKRDPIEKTIDIYARIPELEGYRKLYLKAVAIDMSTTGLGIKIDYPLETGNVVHFTSEPKVHAEGLVKWIMKYETFYRAGVEWLNFGCDGADILTVLT